MLILDVLLISFKPKGQLPFQTTKPPRNINSSTESLRELGQLQMRDSVMWHISSQLSGIITASRKNACLSDDCFLEDLPLEGCLSVESLLSFHPTPSLYPSCLLAEVQEVASFLRVLLAGFQALRKFCLLCLCDNDAQKCSQALAHVKHPRLPFCQIQIAGRFSWSEMDAAAK